LPREPFQTLADIGSIGSRLTGAAIQTRVGETRSRRTLFFAIVPNVSRRTVTGVAAIVTISAASTVETRLIGATGWSSLVLTKVSVKAFRAHTQLPIADHLALAPIETRFNRARAVRSYGRPFGTPRSKNNRR